MQAIAQFNSQESHRVLFIPNLKEMKSFSKALGAKITKKYTHAYTVLHMNIKLRWQLAIEELIQCIEVNNNI